MIAVLVPNLRGCEAAVEAGAHKISIPLSLSETHSIKNVRRDHAQMLEEIAACQALVDQVPEADAPTSRWACRRRLAARLKVR